MSKWTLCTNLWCIYRGTIILIEYITSTEKLQNSKRTSSKRSSILVAQNHGLASAFCSTCHLHAWSEKWRFQATPIFPLHQKLFQEKRKKCLSSRIFASQSIFNPKNWIRGKNEKSGWKFAEFAEFGFLPFMKVKKVGGEKCRSSLFTFGRDRHTGFTNYKAHRIHGPKEWWIRFW